MQPNTAAVTNELIRRSLTETKREGGGIIGLSRTLSGALFQAVSRAQIAVIA